MMCFPAFFRRRAAGRRAHPARRGYTLVETMIAMLLISVVVTSVFSLVLTARMTAKKSNRKGQAVLYVRRAMEALRAYVTSDTTMAGPTANWHINGDTSAGWALNIGSHDISSWLPAEFCAADPANCHLTYIVSALPCGASTCRQVAFTVTWKEPQ